MNEAILFAIKEGVSLLQRHEYNRACEKMAKCQTEFRRNDVQCRREKIDEINRSLLIVSQMIQTLQFQLNQIKSENPNVELNSVICLIAEMKKQKALLEAAKRKCSKRMQGERNL